MLEFVIAGSGAGKTYHVCNELINKSIENPDGNYIIIVPEQYTLQTQKEMVRLHPANGILNIDVLSLLRLAYRVFDELGKKNNIVLEDTGKSMILRKVMELKKDELRIFRNSIRKQGFVSEMKSVISELYQYSITPDKLEDIINHIEDNSNMVNKFSELLIIYKGFKEYLQNKYITNEEVLDILCDIIDESEIIKADVICFDGFTGFTPVQYKLIEKILKHAKKVMITITIDKANYFKKSVKEHELFAFSRTTIDKLMNIANDNNIEVAPPYIIDSNYRFINNTELGHLEENIFRYPYAKYDKDIENISITAASTIDAEAEFVVRNIKKIIREKGYRYRDFAIITGDLSVYAKEFEKIFKRENMQYFIDDKKSIMNNPMVEMTSALFEIVNTNFSYESIFRYIRSTMTNLSRDEADILDNYVVALGKKGYASYSKEWNNSYRTRSSIDIAAINDVRQKLCDELLDFYKNIKKCKTINQFSDCLVSQYENLMCKEKMDAFIEKFEENKELDKAKEYAKVYDSLIELIDKMKNLLGEEEVTIKEYKEILEAGIEEIKVGIIPMTIDQIVVGDIERTRLNDIKVLFFVGVDDRTIPKRKDKSGIISEIDRQFLQDMGVELAPTSIQETYKEQFYLYMAFTKPKEELYISYSNTDNDGKISNASYVIKKIMKLFDNLSVNRDEGSVIGNDMGRTYLVKQLKKKDETDITEILEDDSIRQILSWHLSDDTYKGELDKIVNAVYYHNLDSEISKIAAKALYGFNDKSVTEIEKYASCAYAHFLQYGLKLYENAEYEIKLPDIGTIFHDIVNRFSTAVNGSEYSWAELPEDLRIQFTKECVKEATSDYGNMIMHSSKRNENFIKRIEEVALRTTWALLEHVKQGNFEPYGFEVGFNSKDDYVKGIKLKNGNTVGFKGFIDRVDICNDENGFYVKIIDYKSSKKEFQPTLFLEGIQLQLVVYMNVALDKAVYDNGEKEIVPAGVFYYTIDDPMINKEDLKGGIGEIDEQRLKKMGMRGIINSDIRVLKNIDKMLVGTDGALNPKYSSDIIKASVDSSGNLKASGDAINPENFEALRNKAKEIMAEKTEQMYDGNIKANPYKYKGKTPCDYCQFRSICKFDVKLEGNNYKRLTEKSMEDIKDNEVDN